MSCHLAANCLVMTLVALAGGCYSLPLVSVSKSGVRLVSHAEIHEPVVTRDPVTPAPPSFLAERIVETAAKTAVDVVVELEKELEQVRKDNHHLRQRLQLAEDTIDDQRESMAQATVELNKSRVDFERIQGELKTWRDRFQRLHQQSLSQREAFERAIARMETRLQAMLIQCSDGPDASPSRTGES
jgi:septal ring factor EnvC (AmiA/AmiB activator)